MTTPELDPLHRIDLAYIYPPFLERIKNVLAECSELGANYLATDGFRSFAAQQKLYFQGRTQPGRIVTNATAGFSAHNYGLAIDFCRFFDVGDGTTVSWAPQDYETLGDIVEGFGLAWGGRFKNPDRPHVQWRGFVTDSDLQPLKSIYRNQVPGNYWLKQAWDYVTSNSDTIPNAKPPEFT